MAYLLNARDNGDTHGFFVDNSGKVYWINKSRFVGEAGLSSLPVVDTTLRDVENMGSKGAYGVGKNTIKSTEQMRELGVASGAMPQAPAPTPTPTPEVPALDYQAAIDTAVEEAKAIQQETIDSILELIPEPPIPYDEANPFAFDEVLARASAEQEYVPYYSELLEDYLDEVGVARTRGKQDLEKAKVDINKVLDDYMTESGIRQQRNLEDFEEYGDTIAERRTRLAEEKERGLEEYRIAKDRASTERDAYFEEQRILEGRVTEDEKRELEAQGIDVDRILQLRSEYEAKQERAKERLTEDLTYGIEGLDISGGRVDEDLIRKLSSISAEKESFLGREERAWVEAVEQANEGFAGRGIFFSGIRGDSLKKMGIERGAVLEDYMRGYKEEVDLAEISSGRALEDISRTKERLGVEYERGEEDIEKAVEEYGRQVGWSLEDIDRAKEQITVGAERRREDIGRAGEAYERQYGYTGGELERRQAEMLARAGYEEQDITRALEQYQTGYQRGEEDILRGEEYQTGEAERRLGETELMHQRFVEDLQRQQALKTRDVAREQEAAVLGGVVQRKGEAGEEYEAGREKYYEQYQYPNAMSMLSYYR